MDNDEDAIMLKGIYILIIKNNFHHGQPRNRKKVYFRDFRIDLKKLANELTNCIQNLLPQCRSFI